MSRAASIGKAILAGLIAFCGAVATGYTDDAMSIAEWWSAAAAGLVALGAVWGIPNRAARPAGQRRKNG